MGVLVALVVVSMVGAVNAMVPAENQSTPTPTVTVTVTSKPKVVKVTQPPKVVTKTVRVTERPNRSAPRTKPPVAPKAASGGVLKAYWEPAQAWAQTSKTKAVIQCESSNNPKAVSRTGKYRGLYQMDSSFWASYGGLALAPRPDLATRAEQNYVAYRGYVGRGWSPWTCA